MSDKRAELLQYISPYISERIGTYTLDQRGEFSLKLF